MLPTPESSARPGAPAETSTEIDAESIWRALADPTRRAILDRLRRGALTTGDLAAGFDQTRFGVMKHLKILTEAGLVAVTREGRKRWNHLNPVPLHDVYHRWVAPFEVAPLDRLHRLKRHAERSAEEDMSKPFSQLDIVLEINIDAPVDTVWGSLVDQIGEWWPEDFYVGSGPRRFTLEPRVGGLIYEDWGDGEGMVWGRVLTFQRGRRLQWAGDLSAEFGGPARSVTTYTLSETEDGTMLSFRDTPYGALSPSAQEEMTKGWTYLLEGCFKAFVEESAREVNAAP